jgi:putative flavoprotein involved in K+ transport
VTRDGHTSDRFAGAIDVVVIGAGHAGLSMSYLLAEHGVNHVVLERGEVANSWRNERWDSLKLLTPNRQTRLPGRQYDGDDPDGFMPVSELVRFLEDYAASIAAPVATNTTVTSVRREGRLYRVTTSRGDLVARAVVLATGACNLPSVPKVAADLPDHITQLTPHDYRSPDQVERGGVLIVGASATGLQFADELLRAGHEVTMAAGEHVRMPRRYRGRDIFHWLQRCGIHDERYDEVEDITRGRRLPSPQLVGSHDRPILDLNALADQGARITGRLMGVRDGVALFSGSLKNVCALADLKMQRLLNTIDEAADADNAPAPEQFDATRVEGEPPLTLDLDRAGIRTVVWATGFHPDYGWLDVPVFDRKGQIRHDGGIVDAPGLYLLGLPLMRRRKSSFIFGIEDDARDVSEHLIDYLDTEGKTDGIHQDDTRPRGNWRSARHVPAPAGSLGLRAELREDIQPPA